MIFDSVTYTSAIVVAVIAFVVLRLATSKKALENNPENNETQSSNDNA